MITTTAPRLVASLVLAAVLALPGLAGAADPGSTVSPTDAVTGDQRPGAVLFYNLYSSSAESPSTQDTRISITNTSTNSAAFMRLLFVDGDSGQVASSFICLTANQTATFRASELRPGSTGFLVAVASDGVFGCPVGFNHLVGRAEVNLASGFRGSLEAVAVPALFNGSLSGCNGNTFQIDLPFDGAGGTGYARLPRLIELSSLPSRQDARTLLVLNRIGGHLAGDPATLGTLTGILYDDTGNPFGYAVAGSTPQFRSELSDSFPATPTPFSAVVPPGRTGWTTLVDVGSDDAYLGAALFLRPGIAVPVASRDALTQPALPSSTVTGAVNLRVGTQTSGPVLLGVPVFSPTC